MRIVKILQLAVGLLIVLTAFCFLAAGLLIPVERSFTNEIEIKASAEKVWQVVTDRDKYTEWQTNLTKVEVIDDKSWIEYPRDSPEPLNFSVGKDDRPGSMAFEYTMGNSFEGTWHGYITKTTSGVHLETRDAYLAKGWITKILVYLFFDFDKFAKDWNGKLKQRVESLNQ